jgi:hypothetical protein
MSEETVCDLCGEVTEVSPEGYLLVCRVCSVFVVSTCDFCGASPASDYTSCNPPHETISCCDDCREYHKSGFDGF